MQPMHDETKKLIERAFWWLLGIASTLFVSAASAVVAVLWSMNGSIATLNERVGHVIEESSTFRQEVTSRMTEFSHRLHRVEDLHTLQEKREP